MRNMFLAVAAVASLGVSAAQAMPSVDASGLASGFAAVPVPHIEKTVVVVTRRVVRPARTVCTTRIGPRGRVIKVCRSFR